jgi:threonine dehydrogenase-like Zn-dependent dehydrogenase
VLALGFRGPWTLELETRPDPVLAADEVLISIVASGICGSDVHGYSGETDRRHVGQIMGHECVGLISEVGASVSGLAVGTPVTFNPILSCGQCESCRAGETQQCELQRVIGVDPTLDGSFAELIAVPASNVVPISSEVPLLHGALVEPLAVGYHALMRGTPTVHDRVLVIGGGPIGQAVALACRRLGIRSVVVSEPEPVRRSLLEALGFATAAPAALAEAVEAVLGGPATLVVDAVGIRPSVADAFAYSVRGARVVLVGMGAVGLEIAPYGISTGERTLIGSYCYSQEHFRSTADWVSEGHPELDLLIEGTNTLAEGAEAFRGIADGSALTNKVLLLANGGVEGGVR